MSLVRLLVAYFSFAPAVSATFHLAQEFIGDNFFTGWDFSGGYDDTTSGAHMLFPLHLSRVRLPRTQVMSTGSRTPLLRV